MKKLAIASHAALIEGREYDGIVNVLIEALSTDSIEFDMVRHSMDGLLPSVVRSYKGKTIRHEKRLLVLRSPAFLRYITEFFVTVAYFTFKRRVNVYIGINPLNAVAAIILKKIHRVDRAVFYSSDYTAKRFGNTTMNRIYHAIDVFCVKNADEVWCVSTRIQQIRRDMGLAESKNILVPNVPPAKFSNLLRNKHEKQTLITNGIVDKQLDFEGAIRAVAKLRNKYKDLQFIIIGNGPEQSRLEELTKKLKLTDRVKFMGRLPLSDTLELTSRAGIGLALYTGIWGFNINGDSTKCREFAYFGLPIISTNSHSTVQEIEEKKAGLIVDKNIDAYVTAIVSILDNYESFSKASAALGKMYNDIHRRQIIKLVQDL